MAKKTPDKKTEIIPVEYGNVNIGDQVARISLKIDRAKIDDTKALALLCARRLTGTITVANTDVDPRQKNFFDLATASIEGSFDTRRVSVGPNDFGTGVTVALAEIDVEELGKFAKKKGFLWIDAVEEIQVDEPEDGE
jgi:hypothetical protein